MPDSINGNGRRTDMEGTPMPPQPPNGRDAQPQRNNNGQPTSETTDNSDGKSIRGKFGEFNMPSERPRTEVRISPAQFKGGAPERIVKPGEQPRAVSNPIPFDNNLQMSDGTVRIEANSQPAHDTGGGGMPSWLIAVLVLLLIGGAGGGLFYFLSGSQSAVQLEVKNGNNGTYSISSDTGKILKQGEFADGKATLKIPVNKGVSIRLTSKGYEDKYVSYTLKEHDPNPVITTEMKGTPGTLMVTLSGKGLQKQGKVRVVAGGKEIASQMTTDYSASFKSVPSGVEVIAVADVPGFLVDKKSVKIDPSLGQATVLFDLVSNRGILQINAAGVGLTGTTIPVKILDGSKQIALAKVVNGVAKIEVPVGKKLTLKVAADGYEAAPVSTTLTKDNPSGYVRMDVQVAIRLTVNSVPNAAILVDDVRAGVCDGNGNFTLTRQHVDAGNSYKITAKKSGYTPASTRVTAKPGKTSIRLALNPIVNVKASAPSYNNGGSYSSSYSSGSSYSGGSSYSAPALAPAPAPAPAPAAPAPSGGGGGGGGSYGGFGGLSGDN